MKPNLDDPWAHDHQSGHPDSMIFFCSEKPGFLQFGTVWMEFAQFFLLVGSQAITCLQQVNLGINLTI
jgi:hypothetical protein